MGLWLNQLYDVDDLKALDHKHHELLKNEIRKHLATHPEIIRVLQTAVDPMYQQLTGRAPQRRK
jgi:hypothetical protein